MAPSLYNYVGLFIFCRGNFDCICEITIMRMGAHRSWQDVMRWNCCFVFLLLSFTSDLDKREEHSKAYVLRNRCEA
jgi:hypothetical protein